MLVAAIVATMVTGAAQGQALKVAPDVGATLERYCVSCHNDDKAKGDVNLAMLLREGVVGLDVSLLDDVEYVLSEGDMPPKKAERQPGDAERAQMIAWAKQTLVSLEKAQRNDPGVVVVPRLNNDQYNHVIRDLTGVDLQPAKYFPADMVAANGFANVGEVLTVSPQHVEAYLAAAQRVTSHAAVTPERGIRWLAEAPVDAPDSTSLADRELDAWVAFHAAAEVRAFGETFADLASHDTLNFAGYLEAAWRFERRAALGEPGAPLAEAGAAVDEPIAQPVLLGWHKLLTGETSPASLRPYVEAWRAIPADATVEQAKQRCNAIAAALNDHFTNTWNDRWFNYGYRADRANNKIDAELSDPAPKAGRKGKKNDNAKPNPLVDEARYGVEVDLTQLGDEALRLVITDVGDAAGDVVTLRDGAFKVGDGTVAWAEAFEHVETLDGRRLTWTEAQRGDGKPSRELRVEAPVTLIVRAPRGATRFDVTAQLGDVDKAHASVQVVPLDRDPTAFEQRVFPRRYAICWPDAAERVERDMDHLMNLVARSGRHQSGEVWRGYANVPGVDPADLPEPNGQRTRDGVESALYFLDSDELVITLDAKLRAERDTLAADMALLAERPHRRLAELLAKRRVKRGVFDAMADQGFAADWSDEDKRELNERVEASRRFERELSDRAAAMLRPYLRRAWRRTVTDDEMRTFLGMYERSRRDGASFEQAVQRPMTVAMVVPQFLYRLEKARQSDEPYTLSGVELANRLAFFLWGSGPDDRLLTLGESGELTQPDVLKAEARRMLADARARHLAVSFAGRWLGFYDFENYQQPDTDRFPQYTESLRKAMYEETILFFMRMFAEDRPVTEIIDARTTFLNEELARHYGIDGVAGEHMRLVELPAARRSGVLSMGSVLTVTSTPLRTSPVLRGDWVLEKVLGVDLPEPPADVEPLSEDETNTAGQSIREQLAVHRANPACASCHDKLDPLGLALENFDAIGRWRDREPTGEAIESRAEIDGKTFDGFAGLREHLLAEKDRVTRQFARKLTTFALGRHLQAGDRTLIRQMTEALAANDDRMVTAVEVLVTSPQFTTRRDAPAERDSGDTPKGATPTAARD